MPVAVPLIAAAAGSAVAASSIGATITLGLGLGFSGAITAGYLAGAVVATAINAVGSRALAKKPEASGLAREAQGRALSFRAPAESHKIVYGTVRVSGPIIFMGTTSDGEDPASPPLPNKFLHYIIPLACHEVEEIGDVYLDDTPLALNADGYAVNAPYSRTTEATTARQVPLVSCTSTSYDDRTGELTVLAVTAVPHGLTANRGITIGNTTERVFNISVITRSIPSPTSLTFVTGGGFGPGLSSTGGVIGVIDVTSSVASFVRVRKYLGAASQAADESLTAYAPDQWTPAHRGRGIAYLHVRFEKSDDAFPFGPPNVSALVRGKKVYDPRNGQTYFSDNAALCVRDYLTSRDGSALDDPYGFGIEGGRIDDASVVAAANVCSEDVPRRDGTTQARYPCNGVIDTATGRLDNLTRLLTSMAGTVVEVQDRFRVHAAAYESPAMDLTADMLAGPVRMRTRTPRQDLFNAVRGVFVDPSLGWQPTDFPMVTNALYRSQDNGELLTKDVELPFTTDREGAQRLAKILLEKGRQGITFQVSLMHHAIRFSVWDVVTVTNEYFGWDAKPFRVLDWSMEPGGPVDVRLQEESAASYDWSRGEAQAHDAAPDTNLPDPLLVQPPGALTVGESLYITRSGDGVKARVSLAWLASPDPFAREYQAEYRTTAGGGWTRLNRTAGTTQDIDDIAPGIYQFRVKAVSNLGVSSEYSTASRQVSGLEAPPAEPRNLTISTIGGLAILRWDESLGNGNLDVRMGGHIVFRHSPDLAAGWAQTTTIGNAVPGAATTAILPLKPGIYLAKSVDSSRIESVSFASVRTEQATALAYANVTALTEDPGFTGAKADVAEIGGVLRLAGGMLVSGITLMSAEPSIALSGGVRPSGTYSFSGAIDLGSVRPVRATSRVLAEVVNQLDTIRSRTARVGSWKSISGADAAEGDARVYARTTDDDPAGAPAWGDWHRLDSGEFSCRAIQAELRMESLDPAYNVLVSELSLTIDEVA